MTFTKLQSFALLTLLISASSIHARIRVVGPYMDPDFLPQGSCLVETREPSRNKNWTCSATLIESNEIVSAKHCFTAPVDPKDPSSPEVISKEKIENATVTCTNLEQKSKTVRINPSQLLLTDDAIRDTALGKLEATPIIPLSDAKKAELQAKGQKQESFALKVADAGLSEKILAASNRYDCAVIAYGQDNWGVTGKKNGVLLKNAIQKLSTLTIEFFQETTYSRHRSVVLPGDSGGTIACRYEDEWVLIGMSKEIEGSREDATLGWIGRGTVITQEFIAELRAEEQKNRQGRIEKFRAKKSLLVPASELTADDPRIVELHEAGYSVQDLLQAGHSLKQIAFELELNFEDLQRQGFDRQTLLKGLAPTFPTYIEKNIQGTELSVKYALDSRGIYIRKDAVPCSVIQTSELILAYDSTRIELTEKSADQTEQAKRFSSRIEAEEHLIRKDKACLNPRLKKFVYEHRVSNDELINLGMSEFLIKLINAQQVRLNLSPKAKSGLKRPSRASLKRFRSKHYQSVL